MSSHGGTIAALRRRDGSLIWQLRTARSGGVVARRRERRGLRRCERRKALCPECGYREAALGLRPPRPHQLEPVCRRPQRLHHHLQRRSRLLRAATPEPRSGFATSSETSCGTRASTPAPPAMGTVCTPCRSTAGCSHFDAETGETAWEVHTGGFTYGTPSIADGRVFVADLDGVYAHSGPTRHDPLVTSCARTGARDPRSWSATSSSTRRSKAEPLLSRRRPAHPHGSSRAGKYAPGDQPRRSLLLLAERVARRIRRLMTPNGRIDRTRDWFVSPRSRRSFSLNVGSLGADPWDFRPTGVDAHGHSGPSSAC